METGKGMQQVVVTIENEIGLHARPATRFVRKAMGYHSKITVKKDGKVANGKSTMSVMLLLIRRGDEIRIIAEGPDEDAAIIGLTSLINDDFIEGCG